eukprot:TRINITY_DN1712_c0_g1_i2.p1 TRINITY_DN1712_c0_g1~~TRINITY_DN1712_c0_g1_i2.p1  ORF type:complete len:157 (-),score=40.45 TRINITY_DN1712_c0_g1_i2:205-675(-)
MRVDRVSWEVARRKVDVEMNSVNDHWGWLVTLPYKVGVALGLIAAFSAVPLVFHLQTAAWFNDNFVGEDLPEGGLETLDSIWKVGHWTWGWMEPYLGTASFVLLGMQFTRANMKRLKWKPYTETILSWRANKLAKAFPKYNRTIVRDYSKSDAWHE